jgi:hypothetical protein
VENVLTKMGFFGRFTTSLNEEERGWRSPGKKFRTWRIGQSRLHCGIKAHPTGPGFPHQIRRKHKSVNAAAKAAGLNKSEAKVKASYFQSFSAKCMQFIRVTARTLTRR